MAGGQTNTPDAERPGRLLNLHEGAAYLNVSYWTLRDYVAAGLIPIVDLPGLRPREGARARQRVRRVLVDREDLDRFVESRKRVCVGSPFAEDMRSSRA